MSLANIFSKILEKLYRFHLVKALKEYLRTIKHAFLGKSDIYWVIDAINSSRSIDNPVKIVFDVGAATGDKTLTLLKEFPQSIVYCFEPQKKSFLELKKRTAKWQKRLRLFPFGLLDKNQELELRLYSYPDASSILPIPEEMKKQNKKEIGKETIKVYCLDDIVKKLKIEKIDFLKIDVEGVEKEVLLGARETLKKIDNIFIEILPLRKNSRSKFHLQVFQILYDADFSFIGCFGDYFFSKDKNLIQKYFGEP